MHRPPTAEAEVAAELAALRPALVPRFAAELPGARAAVLTRLWRALAHEPLPWIERRVPDGDGLVLHLADGRRLRGPAPTRTRPATGSGPSTWTAWRTTTRRG